MNDYLFILGNGFDLDLGLHTTYSDFWASEKWSAIRNKAQEHYLITALEKYRITNHWFDLESGLLQLQEKYHQLYAPYLRNFELHIGTKPI